MTPDDVAGRGQGRKRSKVSQLRSGRAAVVGSSNSFQLRLLCSSTAAAPFQQQGLHLYSTSGAAQVQGFENRVNIVIAIKSEKYGEEHGGGAFFFLYFFFVIC